MQTTDTFEQYAAKYASTLSAALAEFDWTPVAELTDAMRRAWREGKQVFLCGNGGSAANAVHWANDYVYPICKSGGPGIKIIALPANVAVLTCIANDESYDEVFSRQLETFGGEGDLLIAMSGSGNSENIVQALSQARQKGMKTFAILGFNGGRCLKLADTPILFPVNDMQIAEDFQMLVCHMVMQALCRDGKG